MRSTNLKPVRAWAEAVNAGLPATASAETLSPRQRWGEALWLGLRRREGVDLDAVAGRLCMPLPGDCSLAIEAMGDLGLLKRNGDNLRLTSEGLLQADRVGEQMLA